MNETTRRGYPLAVLFVLITACAALIAAIAPVIQHLARSEIGWDPILAALIGGATGGLFLGAIVGITQHGWKLGAAIGLPVGMTLGIAGGLLALAPANQLPRIAIALVVGSGLMIGVAVFMRQSR